jgi:hypothetical protein
MDERTSAWASCLVKFRKALWGFLYSRPEVKELFFVVFDAKVAGVKTMDMDKFATGDAYLTLQKIKPAAKAVFRFTNQHLWGPCDISVVDAALVPEGIE